MKLWIQKAAACLAEGKQVGFYSDYPVEGVLPNGLVWCKKEALYKSMSPQPHTVRGADTTGKKFTCIKLPDAFLAATGNAEIICLHDL